MASELETRIRRAAEEFASTVLGTLRGMTLDDLAGLVEHPDLGVVGRRGTRGQAQAKPDVTTPSTQGVSAKQAAARRVQGQYLGYLRNFVGAQRAHIIALGRKSGIPAAVAEMLKLRGQKGPARAALPAKAPAAKTPARKLRVSSARAAQLKVQGMYIGLMRSLPAAEKVRVKAIAARRGMAAAVAEMQRKKSGK
jgi:hypothetical protein